MTDVTKLPTTEEIELMDMKTLLKTFNNFASTAGQNPTKKFATRAIGTKRTIAVCDALRAKGITTPAAPTTWPLITKPVEPASNVVPMKKSNVPGKTAEHQARTTANLKMGADAAPKAKAVAATPAVTNRKKPNLSLRLRELISQKNPVLDNEAIWKIVQPEFKLADDKKGYVAGQRRAMDKRAKSTNKGAA